MNMESSDAIKSDENAVPYRRRISSILKAPPASIRFVETPVKVAKPAEKRNSKRVSFAPDVRLLNDLKNYSPGQSPLRNLTAVENPDMRPQFGVIEERIPPVTGMETLLKAPLQTSQERTKEIFMANYNAEAYYGEKTMIFTENGASMDITHSHTILIASDSELNAILPNQSGGIVPSCGNMDFPFTTKRSEAEMSNASRNVLPSVCDLDPEFENFLASISKPSNTTASSVLNKVVHSSAQTPQKTIETWPILANLKGHCAGRDKENKEPAFMSMEKTLHNSQSIGQASNRSAVLLEDKGMDMTEAINGHIGENAPHNEPLSCLFPTSDLWFNDHRNTTENNLALHRSESLGCTSSTRKPSAVINSKTCGIATNAKTFNVDVLTSKKRKSLSFMPASCRTNTSFEANPDDMDMTKCQTGFIGESNDMEITKSQTVVNDAKSLCPVNTSQNNSRKSLALMLGSTKASYTSEDECGMETIKAPTVTIDHKPLSSLFKKKAGALESESNSHDMEFTRCQTSIIESKHLDVVKPSLIGNTGGPLGVCDPCKTLFSEDEGTNMTAHQGVRSNYNPCESDDMEMTRCQTVAIDAKSLQAVNQLQKRKSLALVPASSKASNILEDDCNMEMTKALTVSIDHKTLGCLFPKENNPFGSLGADCDSDDMEFTRCQTRIIEAKSIDVSKPSLISGARRPPSLYEPCRNLLEEDNKRTRMTAQQGESTIHNACESDDMEMTRCQTVAIDAKSLQAVSQLQKRKSLAFVPASTKACNTSEDDCNMEMTKALTVSIDHKTLGYLFPKENNPVETECDSDDMEFTRCQTDITKTKHLDAVNSSLSGGVKGRFGLYEPNAISHQGEFSNHQYACESDDMEMTRCQTAAIEAKSLQAVNLLHKRKSLALTNTSSKARNIWALGTNGDSGDMELTKCQTGIIEARSLYVSNSNAGSAGSINDQSVQFQLEKTGLSHKKPTSSDPIELEMTKSHTVAIESNVCIAGEALSSSGNLDLSQARKTIGNLSEDSNSQDDDCSLVVDWKNLTPYDRTEEKNMAFSRHGAIGTEKKHEGVSMSASILPDHTFRAVEAGALNIEQEGLPTKTTESSPHYGDQFGICTTIPDSLESKQLENGKENSSLLQGLESSPHNSPADHKVAMWNRTRRRSLADLQSKLRRLSHRMNEPVEHIALDSCTAPLAQPETDFDKNSDATQLPVVEKDPKMEYTVKDNFAPEPPAATASLNLRSKHFMSRRSMGSFMPKLPQKVKTPAKPSNVKSVGKPVEISSISDKHSYSNPPDTIFDEVLLNTSIDEDVSETLDTQAQGMGDGSLLQETKLKDAVEDDFFEESSPNLAHGKKRPLPEDYDDNRDDKIRRKTSTDKIHHLEQPSQITEHDINLSTATSVITQIVDSSNSSNTATVQSEATLESIMKQSLFESQLEDVREYTSDVHKKMDGDRITMLEFFKLFNLDFVIHNPRQSVLPGKLPSDKEPTAEDLLKNRHINCPKLKVYELEHHHLTEKVEGLKIRMRDRERPLKSVNRPLWEGIRNFSEKELKSFGARLKQRSNWFRKKSKCQSHEMKELLYSDLRNANMEEQQKLRRKIAEADEMLRNMDDCIHELETELSAVEGNGLEDTKPTLKSSKLALENVTRQLTDNERKICELDVEKKQNMDKLNKLKTETQDLQNHIATLHMVNEFKVKESRSDGAIYTFLYESLHLEVVFGNCDGAGESGEPERNVCDITFRLELDEERSQPYACLVHNLLSQYLERETSWVTKYPTSGYIPRLLHDVGLVVSRLRLLGEEVRLLKMWAGLRLDMQDISCVHSQVHILFSSLKAVVKFEINLSVSIAYPLCPLQVQHFKSHIGDVTAEQIQAIVSSVSPGRKYLTGIVKRIHEVLL